MRFTRLFPLLLLVMPAPALAQETISDYISKLDYFSINMPSEPKIEEIKFDDEYRITLPARVYTATQGRNVYKVTVVDYRGAMKIHAERNAKCIHDAGADKP